MITKTTITTYDRNGEITGKTVEEFDNGLLACEYCDSVHEDFDDAIQIDPGIDLTNALGTLAKGAVFLASFLLVRKFMKK